MAAQGDGKSTWLRLSLAANLVWALLFLAGRVGTVREQQRLAPWKRLAGAELSSSARTVHRCTLQQMMRSSKV